MLWNATCAATPWSDEELQGGIIWEGAVRAMVRDAPYDVIYEEAAAMAKDDKPDFSIDLYLAIDERHDRDLTKLWVGLALFTTLLLCGKTRFN